MKFIDFLIIGGGIAGLLTYYRLKDYNTVLVDKNDILNGASGAAGAFLFPKVGFDTLYTRFINEGIYKAVEFYKNLGIDTSTKGVLILPRDEKDIEKFKKYEKEIKIPFEKKDGGFFFDIGSVVEPSELKNIINPNNLKLDVRKIEKKENYWIVNDEIKAKNIIFATGYHFKNQYINIRAVWGERIKIKAKFEGFKDFYYHKNCSVQVLGDELKIGATHKRNCPECKENEKEAEFLIQKANEIGKIYNYEIKDIKGGFRAASVDYFPVVGKIIDIKKTLLNDYHIVKGDKPKEIFYEEGLFVINGMGGRGFSNAVVCSEYLSSLLIENKEPPHYLDSKRLFIKWARKKGEEYLRRINA